MEAFMRPYKSRLFEDVSGTVLEIGPGSGINLRYLAGRPVRWIGIEPNPFMRQHLLKEAGALGIQADVRDGSAEHLPVPENSMDAVISTLVLCSVMDQRRVLEEVLRVLKPGGKFLFIEHVAAPQRSWLRRLQGCIRPLWQRMADGCEPDRETWQAIADAGFRESTIERFNAPIPVVKPHMAGVAIKG